MKSLIQKMRFSLAPARGLGLHSPEENWIVAGAGNIRGSEWREHAQVGAADRAADLSWLEGFFSGLSLGENFEFLRTDNDWTSAIEWMDRRLAGNPNEKACRAAAQLAAQLRDPRRPHPW